MCQRSVDGKRYKLGIELVPFDLWNKGLRYLVSRDVWDAIRKKAYADAGYECKVCGRKEKLYCHEVWSYDDEKRVQKLEGFEAVCQMCNWVHHIGLAGVRALDGELDFDKVVRHFLEVNGCTREEYSVEYDRAFEVWMDRLGEWKTDIGEYAELVEIYDR